MDIQAISIALVSSLIHYIYSTLQMFVYFDNNFQPFMTVIL